MQTGMVLVDFQKNHYVKTMNNLPFPSISINRIAFALLLLFLTGVQCFGDAQIKKRKNMTKLRAGDAANDLGPAVAVPGDEAAIRALEERFAAAFNAGDIDAMMKNYVADKSLVVFDIVPPRQHLGANEYRKAWEGFFSHFKGRPKITINDLGITVDGNVGFSHSIQHVTGTDMQGHPVDRTVRVTDGYHKIGGNWLIVLEHISVPVDLKTGKPDFSSKL